MSEKIVIPPGTRFARLVVIKESTPSTFKCGSSHRKFLCRCDCGSEVTVFMTRLHSRHTQSCGCYQREMASGGSVTHGHTRGRKVSRTYTSWAEMIKRCSNPKCRIFKHYGGRGIIVCERWKRFENFLADMGERPTGRSLDRKDNGGNYDPGNCKWSTQSEQMRNTRVNHIVTVRGVTGCVKELAERFNVHYGRTKQRLHKGWPPEKAFFQPLRGST